MLELQAASMHGNPQWFISKDPLEMQETQQEPRIQSLGQEDPLDKEMATHSSIIAWEIPQTAHEVTKDSDTT